MQFKTFPLARSEQAEAWYLFRRKTGQSIDYPAALEEMLTVWINPGFGFAIVPRLIIGIGWRSKTVQFMD